MNNKENYNKGFTNGAILGGVLGVVFGMIFAPQRKLLIMYVKQEEAEKLYNKYAK